MFTEMRKHKSLLKSGTVCLVWCSQNREMGVGAVHGHTLHFKMSDADCYNEFWFKLQVLYKCSV